MTLKETHLVPLLESKYRLSDYPVEKLTTIQSKSALKKHIKKGWVYINDKVALSGTYITTNDTIKIYNDTDVTRPKRVPQLDITVLYEDDYIAIINKPPGVQVSGNIFRTVQRALPQHLLTSPLPDALLQPQPAHRLDFPTSGVLVIGKTMRALTLLNQIFENKLIHKTYYAVVSGLFSKTKGILSDPIDGKTAESHYHIIQSIPSPKFGTLNLVRLRPITGRRHQLRIHLSLMGNAILGDADYGSDIKHNSIGKGLFLHAHQIEFLHPITQELISISSPLPKKFNHLFSDFKS